MFNFNLESSGFQEREVKQKSSVSSNSSNNEKSSHGSNQSGHKLVRKISVKSIDPFQKKPGKN